MRWMLQLITEERKRDLSHFFGLHRTLNSARCRCRRRATRSPACAWSGSSSTSQCRRRSRATTASGTSAANRAKCASCTMVNFSLALFLSQCGMWETMWRLLNPFNLFVVSIIHCSQRPSENGRPHRHLGRLGGGQDHIAGCDFATTAR